MRRNMVRTAGILFLSFLLSMGMVGCAGKGDGKQDTLDIQNGTLPDSDEIRETDPPDSQSAELNNGDGEGGGNEINVYFEGADLNGRVLEFSDTGFTITPVHTVVYEDGTRSSWEAAPGKEREEDNIYVTYTEDTAFEVVYFSMNLQEVSSREDTDKSSVKKETMVYVFGSSEDGKNWTADKVLIQRWN